MKYEILRCIIKETLLQINESEIAADILRASHKNVLKLTGNSFKVPKYDLEAQVRSMPTYQKLSVAERCDLDDIIDSFDDDVTIQDIAKAANKLKTMSVPEKISPADLSKTPMPSQTNVSQILEKLAIKYPEIFGPASESERGIALLAKSYSEQDRKTLTHGMSASTENLERVYQRFSFLNASGDRQGFGVWQKMGMSAMYDVYTGTFVSARVFAERNKIYSELLKQGILPSPINMARSKIVRNDKI